MLAVDGCLDALVFLHHVLHVQFYPLVLALEVVKVQLQLYEALLVGGHFFLLGCIIRFKLINLNTLYFDSSVDLL